MSSVYKEKQITLKFTNQPLLLCELGTTKKGGLKKIKEDFHRENLTLLPSELCYYVDPQRNELNQDQFLKIVNSYREKLRACLDSKNESPKQMTKKDEIKTED